MAAAAPSPNPNPHKPLHIVMFPWLAFGHIIPYLELSKLIAQKGHKISFITTPRNLHRIPQFASPHPSISFVPLPLPTVPGLPPNAEATTDIHGAAQTCLLKKAYDGLEPAVVRFLEESSPDWIIMDFAPHWLPPHTARLGISAGFFFIINAWFLSFFGSADQLVHGSDYRTRPEDYLVPPRWVEFESKLALRRFEINWMMGTSQGGESGFSDAYRTGKVILGCDAILLRHCREFEPNWLGHLEKLHHRRVVPLGLMPPNIENKNSNNDDDRNGKEEAEALIISWLDGQGEHSVVYVALGSEVNPSPDQIRELAHGLDLSGVPFFFVLRNPTLADALPAGFEERVAGRGIVWKKWAPQLKILSHQSVGGFLTHCGWSSIVESLVYGHPVIALPFIIDQGLNSRIMAHQGLAFEIPLNEEDGTFTRESVAESVRAVMVEEEGRNLRERAKEAKKLFSDTELQSKYTDEFVGILEDHTRSHVKN